MNQAQLAQPSRRRRVRQVLTERESARVTVSWTPGHREASAPPAPTTVELVNGIETEAGLTWTCPENTGPSWLEALASAHCSEVILTARIGHDLAVKHSVLQLAELLTFRLTQSQPLIRVRFVTAASAPSGRRSHA